VPESNIVLVVDDDPNVGYLISAILRKHPKYRVVSLYNGDEVLEFIKTNSPDIILLDLKMPGIDGFELCKKIRDNANTKNVPIIVISGISDTQAKIESIELGADDFITKPFEIAELRARINRILLRKTTDISTNPLTHLPGNPAIQEETISRIKRNEDFVFAYIDLDNFKAYNDIYGYAKGDEIIKFTADILKSAQKFFGSDMFLGHVGGDDFVLIAAPADMEKIAKKIIEDFDKNIASFYTSEHRKKGYITTTDRKGNMKDFPLITMTMAIVSAKDAGHYGKLTEKVAELKRYAKKLPGRKGSIYFKDRRDK